MKKKIIIFSSIGAAILIAAIVLVICLCLPKGKTYRSIKVFDLKGTVLVTRNNNDITAKKEMKLKNEDIFTVKEESSAILKLDNDKFIMVEENTKIKLEATGKSNNTKTRLLVYEGGVIVEVKEKLKESESFEIASSNSVMAIRGTRVQFVVTITNEKITTLTKLLEGKVDLTALKKAATSVEMLTTSITDNTCLTFETNVNDTLDIAEAFKNYDANETTVVSNSELTEALGAIFRELTSEEIDNIVDTINEFERKEEEFVNGVIKFSNDVSKLEYGKSPIDSFITDKEYKDLAYYYSSTIDGEFVKFDENTVLDLGSKWYFKAISESQDAYRSDIFAVEIVKQNLTLSIGVSQTQHMASVTSADIVISIVDDEFFNSDLAKEVDENMQPLNYIICKAKYYDESDLISYYYGELNYRNKEIVFSKDVFSDASYASEITPKLEFEYHIDSNYIVTNPEEVEYTFEDQLIIDNIICYYNFEEEAYYIQFKKGSYYAGESQNNVRRSLSLYVDNPDNSSTSRFDCENNDDQVKDGKLSAYYNDNGVYKMQMRQYSAYDGEIWPNSTILMSGDWFTLDTKKLDGKIDAGKMNPYINLGNNAYIVTYNEDGTINLYIDLQYQLELQENYETLALNDYLVRFNEKDSDKPDKYISGNGRYLILEDLPMADYVIKDVFAVEEVDNGITYASSHKAPNMNINLISDDMEINEPERGDDGLRNRLTFMSSMITSDVTVIDSLGNSNTYMSQDADSDYYHYDVNYVIVKATYQRTILGTTLASILNDSSYIGIDIVSINDETLADIKTKLKNKFNVDVKGYTSGEFAFKIYFTTGQVV